MTNRGDPLEATARLEVLDYETSKAGEWVRPPGWLRCAVMGIAVFILAMFLLGLPLLSGASFRFPDL